MTFATFISHFAYIAIFFALGTAFGWHTYPKVAKVMKKYLRKD
jgi:hypothetical protein